jgi:hypothetical protein
MQMRMAKAPFSEAVWDKFFSANKAAHEKADFDSGWVPTPSDKVIKHNLGRLPAEVWVYASDAASGDPFASDTWTACTANQITITGPSAYCRVRINLGG